MKKCMKKIVVTFLAAMLVVLSASVAVEAKTVTASRVVTLYPSSGKNFYSAFQSLASANINIVGTTDKNGKVTSIKSTDKSVAAIGTKAGKGNAKSRKFIYITAKKAGTATVSYKADGTTYKYKVTVKKYTSPFSSLKLGGTNIASKLKKTNVYTLSYAKYANKNIKLSYKAKSGWSINADYLLSTKYQMADMVKNNGTFKVTRKNSMLFLDATNAKTKQSESAIVIFK